MKTKRKGKGISSKFLVRLTALEDRVAEKGIQIHYDRLEAAGLKLQGGLCALRGKYHLFVEKRKSPEEKIAFLEEYLEEHFPEEIT